MTRRRVPASAGFAGRIVRRYRMRSGIRRPVARLFRQRPMPRRAVRRAVHLHLAPTFRTTVLAGAPPAAIVRRETVVPVTLRGQLRVETAIERVVAREIVRSAFSPVLRGARGAARTELAPPPRSAAGAAVTAPPMALPAASSPRLAPVERVFRRPPAAERREEDAVADGWGPPIAVRRPAAPPRAELGAVELDRLTDHVMRTLDRRLAAHRERHGRA